MSFLICPYCNDKNIVKAGTVAKTCSHCGKFFDSRPEKPFDVNNLPHHFYFKDAPGYENIIEKSNNFK